MNKGQEQSIHRKKVQMASRHLKRCQPPCQYDGMNLKLPINGTSSNTI